MNEYYPHNWVLVKITGTDPHYRVFGSWRGGFADGDSWRMNSGIVSVEEDETFYYFHGYTGSVYKCNKNCYGNLGMYNTGIIQDYCERSQGTMEMVDEMPDVMLMDWIIK
jgi:hypothetical protein